MPFGPDPRYTQDAIIADLDPAAKKAPEAPVESPSVVDTLAAGFRQSNVISSAYQRGTMPDPDLPDTDPNYDPLDHVKGFEAEKWDFVTLRTPSEVEGRKQRILAERQDKETLERAGWGGTATELLGGALDPSFLVGALVPESLLAKGILATRARAAATHGALGAALYEGGMQAVQDDRTVGDSLMNIGSGALLGGVLGHLINKVSSAELAPLMAAIDEEFGRASTAGAAAVRTGNLADETLARGAAGVSKAISKTKGIRTSLDVVLNSESVEARQALHAMTDVSPMTAGNAKGIPNVNTFGPSDVAGSAENAIARHERTVADFIDMSQQEFANYAERVPKGEAGRMNAKQFYAHVSKTLRNGDVSGIPEVDKAAREMRTKVFNPLWEDAKLLGQYEDPVKAAQQRATTKAVDKYVRAESKQQYSNYAANTNKDIKVKLEDFKSKQKEDSSVLENNVRERAAQGLSTIDAVRSIGTAKAESLGDAAILKFEQRLAVLEVPRAGGTKATFGLSQVHKALFEARNELTRATDVIKSVRTQTVEKATTQAQRTKASAVATEQITALRTEFNANAAVLRAKLRDSVAKAKLAAKDVESKSLRKAAKQQLKAAHQLRRELNAAKDAARAERQVAANNAKKIRADAAKELADLRTINARLRDDNAQALGRPLTRRRFMKEAAKGGSADKNVQAVTKLLQDQQMGKLADRVTVPKVDPRYINKLMADKSYFTRMFDREALRLNRAGWDQKLFDWFSRSSEAAPEEIKAAVKDATDKILGNDVGLANFHVKINTPKAGPLNDRTLDIPSDMIEEFLVNDPIKVARAYMREMAPRVELARRGLDDEGMKQLLSSIDDKYTIAAEKAKSSIKDAVKLNKRLGKLDDEKVMVQQHLLRVRDRLQGRASLPDPSTTKMGRRVLKGMQNFQHIVAAAKMGGTAITGGTMDLAKVMAQYGFAPTFAKLAKLAVSPEFRQYAAKQARRAGARVEVALAKRVEAYTEGALTEGWASNLSHGVYKYTGLNHITDFNRTLSAVMFEDEMLKFASKVAKGDALPQYVRTRLASHGLGDAEMKEIAAEVSRHGAKSDGVRISGSADWDNKLLADKYDAAILKDSRITVQQPGAADRVWWMDSPTGKFIGQLKSFALSAPTRMLMGGLQMAGQGAGLRSARFFGYMLIGGYITHAIRSEIAGRKPATSPNQMAVEALTESGLMGIMPDVLAPPTRLFSPLINKKLEAAGLPRVMPNASARYSDQNLMSAYGGPAIGTALDMFGMAPRLADGTISQNDLHAIRRILPYQNYAPLRRGINALEGEVGEAFGLKDSTQNSFLGRLTESTEITQ